MPLLVYYNISGFSAENSVFVGYPPFGTIFISKEK